MVNRASDGFEKREAPKGFEAYFANRKISSMREKAVVDCRSVTQLKMRDKDDMAALRERAIKHLASTHGLPFEPATFVNELRMVPPGIKLTDKLVFRAFEEGRLVGYAQVISGWPKANEWAIDQLVIDPDHSQMGFGSKLINQVENIARTAEAKYTSVLSAVARPELDEFWRAIGYAETPDAARRDPHHPYAFIQIHRKGLL